MTFEWFNHLAAIIGWTAMACGGLLMIGVLIQQSCDFVWRRILRGMALRDVRKAVQAYQQESKG